MLLSLSTEQQQIAQALQAQGVPVVVGLVKGQPVPLFQGLAEEAEVRQYLEQLVALRLDYAHDRRDHRAVHAKPVHAVPAELRKQGLTVTPYQDIRKLLESKEVDAVSIATPKAATLTNAVTILTSLSQDDLERMGWRGSAQDIVTSLARQSVDAGARAIVCSPQEVAAVRAAVGGAVTLITPGVRPAGSDVGDQRRIATPQQALADGADLLVIGRPITGSDDVAESARLIAASL